MTSSIGIIGANPAWQKTLLFDEQHYNGINRAREYLAFPAGKGVNFARALKIHGTFTPELFQFVGGETGRRLVNGLSGEGIFCHNIRIAGENRTCTTCLGARDQSMTELIEPSPAVTAAESTAFLELLENHIDDFAALALCGTMPAMADAAFQTRCAAVGARHGKLLLIDAYCHIEPILESGAPVLLKINRAELAALTGREEVPAALKFLAARYRLRGAAITDGGAPAHLLHEGGIATFTLPPLPKIVNPLGSGDCASAVLLAEYLSHGDPVAAFREALAAASANCLSARCAEFRRDDARAIAAGIVIGTAS